VHPELKSLAEVSLSVSKLIARGDPVPDFDWHCPLLSLPLAFATDLGSIPAQVPYLRAPRDTPCWLQKKCEQGLHVGLVWAGNPKNVRDRKRSLSLAELEPLSQVAGVSFYSLQRGPARAKAASLPFAGADPQTGDFAATAAAIEQLDLIVSVDTGVAHLAGALGKPVWILLPALAEWRWLRDRDDSPWYPTARLFRQKEAGNWASVIEAVAAQLELAVSRRAAREAAAE
jgi:ADP-heptose:LPS heptosyltransferase